MPDNELIPSDSGAIYWEEAVYELSNLPDLEEIKALKSRYFYYVDTKAWDRLRREVFTEDCEFELPGAETVIRGIELFLARISPTLDSATSVHFGHLPEIVFTSADTAGGRWSMDDEIRWPEDQLFRRKYARLKGAGYYHETYQRTNAGWRINSMRLERIFVDLS